MKKVLITALVFFSLIPSVKGLEIKSEHAVLYNLNDNTVVFEKNSDSDTAIASLTKIMTTIVAIENIKDYNEKVTITSEMLKGLKEANAWQTGFYAGQKLTYDDLLYATFLDSGADAARGLAFSLAGSEEGFVKLMNAKAKELGLEKTTFTNPVGLDSKTGQNATVKETAETLIYALKNEKFKEIFYSDSYTLSTKKVVRSSMRSNAKSNNQDISYILGGKTGYTDNAERCLASVAKDETNNITYLLVTTNAPSYKKYYYTIEDARNIYTYYFENYKYHNLVDTNDILVTLKTKYAKELEVSIKAKKDYPLYYENTFDKEKVKLTYEGTEELVAPLKKGTKLGTVKVSYLDKEYETIDIVLDSDLKFSLWVFIKTNIGYILTGILFIIGLIFILRRRKRAKRK